MTSFSQMLAHWARICLIPVGMKDNESDYYCSASGVSRTVTKRINRFCGQKFYIYEVKAEGKPVASGATKSYAGAILTATKYMREWN